MISETYRGWTLDCETTDSGFFGSAGDEGNLGYIRSDGIDFIDESDCLSWLRRQVDIAIENDNDT